MKSTKKFAVAAAAAALCLGVAGNALAAFEYGELTRIYYDNVTANKEVGSDLGLTSNLLATGGSNLNAISLVAGKGFDLSTSKVGYFSYDTNTAMLYISGAAGLTNYKVNDTTGLETALASVIDNYSLKQDGNTMAITTSWSYFKQLDKGGVTPGQLANSATGGNVDASLASLVSASSLTQSLYAFDLSAGIGNILGTEVAKIITNADGSTTIAALDTNTTATPIPAAFYLMGSGLMGLVGLRRKKA
jgi:hypothetical protein